MCFVKLGNFFSASRKAGSVNFLGYKNVAVFIIYEVAKDLVLAYCFIPSDGLLGDLIAAFGEGEDFDRRTVPR